MSSNNNYENQRKRGLKRKLEAIKLLGGGCSMCGYDKNLAALEFHHKNPDEKEFQLDARIFANALPEKIKKELDKCTILCSNCHKEIHNPELNYDEVEKLTINKKGLNEQVINHPICPICGKKFKNKKGKLYCSSKCREINKKYPTITELNEQYKLLESWEKVAKHFGLTRKIVQGIRKKNEQLSLTTLEEMLTNEN